MDQDRIDYLRAIWNDEDPCNSDWYDDLNEDEQALVDEWDRKYESGVLALCMEILKMEEY